MRISSIVAIALLMTFAVTLQAQRTRRVSFGVWGGEHAQLKAGKRGTTIEFDCAHGKMTTPLSVGASGRFAWSGTYIQEGVGPTRADSRPATQTATYSGAINGDTMKLTVTLTETNEEIGNYSLKRGALGNVVKCM